MNFKIRLYYLAAILTFISLSHSSAQISSTLGWFEINFNQGCTPLEVSVKTTISEDQVPLFQFFGRDDPNPVAWKDTFDSLTNTYTSPGIYMVYLTVQNDPQRQDSLQVTVLQSEIPVFELKDCEGNGMLVQIQDTFYDSYIIDYGDGTVVTVVSDEPDPIHTYPDSQTYNVTLTGRLVNAPNNCGSFSQSYTPQPVIFPPFISNVNIDSLNQINLSFNLPQNVNYRLEISQDNDQLFQFFKDLNMSETMLTIPDFSPDMRKYCFRISALNPCGGQRVFSNVVCTISLNLLLSNNEINLSWQNVEVGTETEYRVSRNTISDFITLPSGTLSFDDRQVICKTEYCYTVTTLYSDGAESLSQSRCGEAFSTDVPPVIENLAVDILADGVKLDWEVTSEMVESYVKQYSTGNKLLARDTSEFSTSFLITDLKLYPQTCYTHSYLDICGNTSPETGKICSIFLQTGSNPGGAVFLQWSAFSGLKDSIGDYTVLKFDQNDVLLESTPLGQAFQYTDEVDGTNDQIVKYIIEATPVNNKFQPVHSNKVETARQPLLIFPGAFTPNGDGLNDFYKPEYLFIKSYSLEIYNRWGELLFSTHDIDRGWDGTFKGEMVPPDSYTFISNTEDFRGLKISRSGILVLLNN
ncbi:MAG: gliding motility-associated C-terminal domain-containing protein [Bacteroidetes bacterium]|nr:gliding motility-associated C-terminal domain-containing protein [Bacteroidota bacterium]